MTSYTRMIGVGFAIVSASALVLAGCSSSDGGKAPAAISTTVTTHATTPAATTSADATTSGGTAAALPSVTSAASTLASPSGTAEPTEPPTGVQIMVQAGSSEVSPGTLQYGNYGVDFYAEWTALSGDAGYSGSKCASVVTLTDPAGNILKTDRENTCSGRTDFSLDNSKHGTGEFTIKASIAPWNDADNPVTAEKTINVIENGS